MAYSFGAENKKKSNTKFVNWKDKCYKIKKPNKVCGEQGPVNRLRFLGDPIKYYFHYKKGESHKICPCSLGIRNPDSEVDGNVVKGDYIWKQDNGSGIMVPFTQEQMGCPICDANEKPRKYYAINVIDMDEAAELAKQNKPARVRIMEFSSRIYDKLSKFATENQMHPSDRNKGPVFEIIGYYSEDIDEPQDKDILWKVKPIKSFPLSDTLYKSLFEGEDKRVYDLEKEYHPLQQKFRSVFVLGTDGSDNNLITGKKVQNTTTEAKTETFSSSKTTASSDSGSSSELGAFGAFGDTSEEEQVQEPVYDASAADSNAETINNLLNNLDLA